MGRSWDSLPVVDRGPGPPVLLLHGQPGTAGDWEALVALLEHDHRLLAVDRPGYGASPLQVRSMAGNAELMADLLAEAGASPALVVGHSYGGGVALLMARRRPEAVAGLVLVASVGGPGSVNGMDHVLASPALGDVVSGVGLFALGHVFPRAGALARRMPKRLARRLQVSLPDDRYAAGISADGLRLWRTFVAEQRSLVAEIGDVEAATRGLRVPTGVLIGSWDVVVPPSSAAALAASIPGAELVVVARTGHFPARDAVTQVAALVRRTSARTHPRH